MSRGPEEVNRLTENTYRVSVGLGGARDRRREVRDPVGPGFEAGGGGPEAQGPGDLGVRGQEREPCQAADHCRRGARSRSFFPFEIKWRAYVGTVAPDPRRHPGTPHFPCWGKGTGDAYENLRGPRDPCLPPHTHTPPPASLSDR